MLDNCCCGLPPWSYGDVGNTTLLAEKNLKVFAAADLDVIVTDCSSCASFLKKYPKVFKDDPKNQEIADQKLPMIKDVVEFLYATEHGTVEQRGVVKRYLVIMILMLLSAQKRCKRLSQGIVLRW